MSDVLVRAGVAGSGAFSRAISRLSHSPLVLVVPFHISPPVLSLYCLVLVWASHRVSGGSQVLSGA